MAVTIIPNVTNWSVTPQNGQVGYFTLMNTWLSESTAVIASLQTAIDAQNAANEEVNTLATQAESSAIIATSLANYQGAWTDLVTYDKGQSVSSGTLYYISKVDNNLNHAVTDTNYWLYNPINDKLDKDFSVLADKTTPADSDIFATRETGGLLKKLSWANIKASLDSLYVKLTGDQTIAGIKTFSSSPIVPTPTTGDNSTKVATTAFVEAKSEADSIGVGQSWQDVTSSRSIGVTYTNNTGKPIVVGFIAETIPITDGYATPKITIDGILVASSAATSRGTNMEAYVSAIVPNQSSYVLNVAIGSKKRVMILA